MSACTFFGHRECPDSIRPALTQTVEQLICEKGVDCFYVGNQGRFDALVRSVLRQMQEKYPHIRYGVVLAYLPTGEGEEDTMFPEGLETVHPKFALDRRNRWMIDRSSYAVGYVKHGWGGAAKYMNVAKSKGRSMIFL